MDEVLQHNNAIGAIYVREYRRRVDAAADARRAYMDVDMRRTGAHERRAELMAAWIDREGELEEWLEAIGVDVDA